MAILRPTGLSGSIDWLGIVPENRESIASQPRDALQLDWGGIPGTHYAGLTRPACVRVRAQYKKGTEIANTRQVSIVSAEDLAEIATRLDLARIEPEWLGANIVVSGIPDFTLIPPGTRLIADGGASLVVDMENAPCRFPAEQIEAHHPGKGMAFPKVATNLRGVTAWVERPGTLARGNMLAVHTPPQRLWSHGKTA